MCTDLRQKLQFLEAPRWRRLPANPAMTQVAPPQLQQLPACLQPMLLQTQTLVQDMQLQASAGQSATAPPLPNRAAAQPWLPYGAALQGPAPAAELARWALEGKKS